MNDLAALVTSKRFRVLAIIPAGLAAAVLLGLGVVRFGPVVFGAIAGLIAAAMIFLRPELGMYLLALSLPIEDLLPGVGPATGTRLLGMLVFGIWVVRKILQRESWLTPLKSPLMVGGLLFLGWGFISMLWADTRNAAALGMFSQVQLFFLSVLVVDLMKSWDRANWVARLLVLGGVIAAGFSLEQYYIQGIKRAGDGVSGGINYTASFLVTLLPFAFYLIRARTGGFWTFLGALYIPMGIAAVTVSFSRSSYILLVGVLIVHTWLLLRTRRQQIWLVLLAGLVITALVVAPKEAVNERVQSISPVLTRWITPTEADQLAADARAYHWRVGMAMLSDSPVLGVGFNNYGEEFLSYQFEVPGLTDFFLEPRSAHSSYIALLTELGTLGLGLFLFILGAGVYNLVRAGQWLRRKAHAEKHLYLIDAVFYALVFQILYGWALNTHMNKNLWLILGMSVALVLLSHRAREQPEAMTA